MDFINRFLKKINIINYFVKNSRFSRLGSVYNSTSPSKQLNITSSIVNMFLYGVKQYYNGYFYIKRNTNYIFICKVVENINLKIKSFFYNKPKVPTFVLNVYKLYDNNKEYFLEEENKENIYSNILSTSEKNFLLLKHYKESLYKRGKTFASKTSELSGSASSVTPPLLQNEKEEIKDSIIIVNNNYIHLSKRLDKDDKVVIPDSNSFDSFVISRVSHLSSVCDSTSSTEYIEKHLQNHESPLSISETKILLENSKMSTIKFLFIQYKNNITQQTVEISLDNMYYITGNQLFSPAFVYKCLKDCSKESMFSIDYTIKLMDNTISIVNINSNQYIELGEHEYSIITEK